MPEQPQWQIQPFVELPDCYVQALNQHVGAASSYAAQLLWQRGLRDPAQIPGYLNPKFYTPTPAAALGEEVEWAVDRLQQAQQGGETVAIWGDFDADGITATAVLWEGLGAFFQQNETLTYYIPNRLTESHGLSRSGIDQLAAGGCRLIVTCDTGSTNLEEIAYANSLGLDVIVTDHHTLPAQRPPVVAILNPRYLPAEHPLAHLSGVAVAYKLVEAFYASQPDLPQRPLEDLLDLVAIGLIADLVQLSGDCRYLAQRGIEKLQENQNPDTARRPGIAYLLELCKRSGDRPTDISFGLGPRINAISRIHGDARFCVELLTSRDQAQCRRLAQEAETANARRKSLQKDVVQQVRARLAAMDLSTTRVIVLADPQWSIGVLGLVAGQIAQEYGRPTILLATEEPVGEPVGEPVEKPVEKPVEEPVSAEAADQTSGLGSVPLARGSARSVQSIDLYQLVQAQAHLLHRFGGHPFAAGLSLPVENISLFAEAVNRQLRQQGAPPATVLQADLQVSVAELGQSLFRELKLLEPCGIGNPVPRLLIQNCWFTNVFNRNIQDWRGNKIRYIKTGFELWDGSVDPSTKGFPGVWWEHYKEDMPQGRCDAVVELDFNTYTKAYEVRLIAVYPTQQQTQTAAIVDWIVDLRSTPGDITLVSASGWPAPPLLITTCPESWDEFLLWFRRAAQSKQPVALAYPPPSDATPMALWQQLVGIAKYLSRTEQAATRQQLLDRLGLGDRSLQVGWQSLRQIGFEVTVDGDCCRIAQRMGDRSTEAVERAAIDRFLTAVQEEQFQRRYFCDVPLSILQVLASQAVN